MRLYGIRRENGSVIRTYVPSHLAEPMEFLARVYSEGQLVEEIRVPAKNYPFGDAAMEDFKTLNKKIRGVLRSLEAQKS